MTTGRKKQDKEQTPKQICIKCKKNKSLKSDYYNTMSDLYPNGNYPVCKTCVTARLPEEEDPLDDSYIKIVTSILLDLNKPFIYSLWLSSIEEANKRGWTAYNAYMKNVSMPQNRDLTWNDSDYSEKSNSTTSNVQVKVNDSTPSVTIESIQDQKNKEDVLRMLGYDPFEFENKDDKRHLFNKLVDFLDESTLEDSFKLPTVIEIVKTFNQIDKINAAIAVMTSDASQLASNVGQIKSLIDAKEKMLKSVLALAKDNGISVNHNNNKSKGGNTLNGIVKKLSEIGLDVAEVNLFNLETSESMKQIADFSNRSILDQLMLDENDYTGMIADQNQMIKKLDDKLMKVEEENRLLKIRIKELEQK